MPTAAQSAVSAWPPRSANGPHEGASNTRGDLQRRLLPFRLGLGLEPRSNARRHCQQDPGFDRVAFLGADHRPSRPLSIGPGKEAGIGSEQEVRRREHWFVTSSDQSGPLFTISSHLLKLTVQASEDWYPVLAFVLHATRQGSGWQVTKR